MSNDDTPRVPLYIQILAGMAAGLCVGPILGKNSAPLGELGKLAIQLIKAAATPLLFFSIVDAVLKTQIALRASGRMLLIAACNASVALLIGLGISNLFQPGRAMQLGALTAAIGPTATKVAEQKKLDFAATLASYVPTNFVQPFSENIVISVVLLALLFGFALRKVRDEQLRNGSASARIVEDGVGVLLRMTEILIGWVIRLIPLAVFGIVAKVVGEYGFAPLRGLAVYVAIGLLGLALHVGVTYHLVLRFYARISLRSFWRQAREPVVYALGANSSLATLPLTLRALDRLGVSREAATLGACVGTNFNNDGIILYEGMAVLFVAQANGIHLSVSQQVLAAVSCMVAAMGVAGVPEAGFISLAVVLSTVGLPAELLPLLLTVDWIIARARSVTNVLADMVISIAIDRPNPADRSG